MFHVLQTNCDFYFLPVTPKPGLPAGFSQTGEQPDVQRVKKKPRNPTQIILFDDSVKSLDVKGMFHMGLLKSWDGAAGELGVLQDFTGTFPVPEG